MDSKSELKLSNKEELLSRGNTSSHTWSMYCLSESAFLPRYQVAKPVNVETPQLVAQTKQDAVRFDS